MVAPAPAIGNAGPPAAVVGIIMVMVGLPGCMFVVAGTEGGAALPARPFAFGAMVEGAAPPRPSTGVPVPAIAAPSGGVASAPA